MTFGIMFFARGETCPSTLSTARYIYLPLASPTPLLIKSGPIIERFLGSYSCSGEAGVKVGTLNGLPFRQTLTQEGCETANKRVAGSGAVDAVHTERRHVLHAVIPAKQRSIRTQS